MAPTRELVQQIVVELQKLAYGQDVVGLRDLRRRADREASLRSLVARGRHRRRHSRPCARPHRAASTLYLGDIFHVVLDEADRMLDIGFRPDIERILRKVPEPAPDDAACRRPSATRSGTLAKKYMHQAVELNLSKRRAVSRVDPAVLRDHRARPQV